MYMVSWILEEEQSKTPTIAVYVYMQTLMKTVSLFFEWMSRIKPLMVLKCMEPAK